MVKIKSNKKLARPGLVLCYIGAGKGKTTAAMGVVARASGAGMNVYVLQFVKAASPKKRQKREAGEWSLSNEIIFFNQVKTPKPLGEIKTEQVGRGFVGILGDQKKRAEHITAAKKGLVRARSLFKSKKYNLFVLDELVSAVELNLLKVSDVVKLIKDKPPEKHLIITGHNNYPKILAVCDLVTEMKMIKHPYYKGLLAQKGIDF